MTVPAFRNYSRPASLGRAASMDGDEVMLRWFGTASFELTFGSTVRLLDNYYDRTTRGSPQGSWPAASTRPTWPPRRL